MKIKPLVSRTGVAIALTAATIVLAPATAAFAKPAACSGSLNKESDGYTSYTVECHGGTGSFRAYVDCWHGSTYTVRTGPWTPTNTGYPQAFSQIYCLPGETAGTHFAQMK